MRRAVAKKPGVLIVCDSYPPVLGGSEIEAQRVARGLIDRGYRVRVLCSGGPPMPEIRHWTDPCGIPVSILTRRSRGRMKDLMFALNVTWSLLVRRREYSLVYFLMQGLHLAFGLPTAHLLGKPSVVKISGDGILTIMKGVRMGRFELEKLLEWKIPVMLLNKQMFREAQSVGFPQEQLTWMPNPVEIDLFRPVSGDEQAKIRERLQLPPGAKIVIYTGRLSTEKGIRELMRGVAEAARTCPEARMVLVGDGPIREELQALGRILDQADDRFIFTGRVPLQEIPNWLGAADVFGLTSPNEGFSCSLLEAMSAGLPSVVSNIEANLQLVDEGIHGLTVQWNDPRAIGAALLRLFEDEAMRARMSSASRTRVVENYSMDKVLQRYEALFGRLPGLSDDGPHQTV